MIKFYKYLFFLLLFSVFMGKSFCLVVGSNTAVLRAAKILFPAGENDNEMRGFVFVEDGFRLEDSTTTCTFDALYPVRGNINLAGGTLFLSQDLVFGNANNLFIAGTINGGDKSIEFSKSYFSEKVPVFYGDNVLGLRDIDDGVSSDYIFSADWSYNDTYAAMGLFQSAGQEIEVFTFDGSALTKVDGADSSVNVHCVRWHPTLYYFAVARAAISGNELLVYNVSGEVLSAATGGGDLAASGYECEWHPSGVFLAAGSANTSGELTMWDFNTGDGSISPKQTIDISPNRTVYALSFAPGGNYLAVGTAASGSEPTLLIYEFNGSTLSLDSSVNTGATVYSVDWMSTGTNVAVGMASSSESVRVYEHNAAASTITEREDCRLGEASRVESVHWNGDKDLLLYSTNNGFFIWVCSKFL